MSGVLILGANSDIAKAIAREYAKHKRKLVLASRNVDALNAFVSEYNLPAEVHFFDAEKSDSFEAFLKDIKTDYDTAVCAFGYLPDIESQLQPIEIEKSIAVNYSGAVKILSLISKQFKQQESGLIIGISSVAGDRGKQSTMIYGSAKAGFTSFLDGLRNSLYQSGVHVLTVKPGYVNTKMIKGMETSPILTASPELVAKRIYEAGEKRKNVVYVKSVWRLIMYIIGVIPEFIIKRMRL